MRKFILTASFIGCFLFSWTVQAGKSEDKIFSNFVKQYCATGDKDFFRASDMMPQVDLFYPTNQTILKFFEKCRRGDIKSYPDFKSELQKIKNVCKEAIVNQVKINSSNDLENIRRNDMQIRNVENCIQSVDHSLSAAVLSFNVTKSTCEPTKRSGSKGGRSSGGTR